MMENLNGLTLAFALLVFGIVELYVFSRLVYPGLRARYERAKVTQTQGMNPNRIMSLFRLQSLVLMPVIGFVVGEMLRTDMGR